MGTLTGPQGELTNFCSSGVSDWGPPDFPDGVFCLFCLCEFHIIFPINRFEMYNLLAFSAFTVLYPPPSHFPSPQKYAMPIHPSQGTLPSFLGVAFTLVCM